MKFFCIAVMVLSIYSCHPTRMAHTPVLKTTADHGGVAMLLGVHPKRSLEQAPDSEWFNKNYAAYTVDSSIANQLTPLLGDKRFEIFMGTWCGDSRREVPRMFKLLEYAGVKPSQITMIAVSNLDSSYKQSPGHEEKGKNIFRVPDLIVYAGDQELNRIVESPLVSLEKDLLAIVSGKQYRPHYEGGLYLSKVMQLRTAAELEKDSAAIVQQLKTITAHSSELNSLGHVWLAASDTSKALLAFRLNAMLFPGNASVYESLGAISIKMGQKQKAKQYYQKALEVEPVNQNAAKMLQQLK